MNKIEFAVGQRVLKAQLWGRSPMIEERTVEKIENGKVYLHGDRLVALRFPSRVWVLG